MKYFFVRDKTIAVVFDDNYKYISHACIKCNTRMLKINDYNLNDDDKEELSYITKNSVYCPRCELNYYVGFFEKRKIKDFSLIPMKELENKNQNIKDSIKNNELVKKIVKKYQDKKINKKIVIKTDKKELIVNKITEFRQRYIKIRVECPNSPEILESSFNLVEETLINLSYAFFKLYSKDILMPELLIDGNSINTQWETEFYKIEILTKNDEGFYFYLRDKKNELNGKHGYSTKSNIIDLIIKWMVKR